MYKIPAFYRPLFLLIVILSLLFLVIKIMACWGYYWQTPSWEVPDSLAENGSREARLEQFANTLERFRQQAGIPGMSVAVAQEGELVFAQGFGYADLERGTPASPQTVYYIASLTKPMAATLLLRLAEEERLDLDQPVSVVWPGFSKFCEAQVKPWQRAWTAPLGWIDGETASLRASVRDYRCEAEAARLTVRHHLTHTAGGEPGSAFKYNAYLYSIILKHVAEAASGQSLPELFEESLFDSLEMANTVTGLRSPRAAWLRSALATPYRTNPWRQLVPSTYPTNDLSAGAGVFSTVEDLAKFETALLDNRLISPASRAVMFQEATTPEGRRLPYGLGWFVQKEGELTLAWHYGFIPETASSLMVTIPEQRLTFILLANSDGASAPFPLYEGDVWQSPFAALFLKTFL